jgi:hypothetical protein
MHGRPVHQWPRCGRSIQSLDASELLTRFDENCPPSLGAHPFMNLFTRTTVSLFLLALATVAVANEERVYVGTITEISQDDIDLDQGYSLMSIGFFGEPEAISRLSKLKVGDEVRAVFGSGIPPSGGRPINKLLDIRRCVKNDKQCAADRKAGEAQDAIEEKARAASEEKYAACRRAMHETLLKDPRYVPSLDASRASSKNLLDQVNSFTGQRRVCADKIMNDHQAAVFDACVVHHCGDNIGGGCAHIAGYALTDDAIERAALVCKDK